MPQLPSAVAILLASARPASARTFDKRQLCSALSALRFCRRRRDRAEARPLREYSTPHIEKLEGLHIKAHEKQRPGSGQQQATMADHFSPDLIWEITRM